MLGPRGILKVKTCRFHRQLGINDKCEHSLFLPIDADRSSQVVSEGKFGGELPLLVFKAEALAGAVLSATNH